ncbi:hypothetical protein V3C99_013623 [Haemonchus contortus]
MDCSKDGELLRNRWFLLVIGSQALTGFLSLIVSLLVLKRSGSLYFNINCKILIKATLILFIAHSLFITVLQSLQLFLYLTTADPCSIVFESEMCFSMRFPANVCMISFAALQVSMVMERAIATWKGAQYESYDSRIGYTFTVASVIISIVATAWVMKVEDFSLQYPYCSSATPSTAQRLRLLCFVLCGVDIATIGGIIALSVVNHIATKHRTYDLRSSYQLHENAQIIKLILPLTLFQTITYAFFSSSSATVATFRESFSYVAYRTIFASTYIIPYYTMVSPVMLWFIIRQSRRMRKAKLKLLKNKLSTSLEKDVYFRAYTEMWKRSPLRR